MLVSLIVTACSPRPQVTQEPTSGILTSDTLADPYASKSVMNFSNVIGWENGRTPQAPTGFSVVKYSDGFENPRWLYALPNGDVLVAESNSNHSLPKKIGALVVGANKSNNLSKSADRITILRDADGDGKPEKRGTFLKDLNQPFGMLLLNDTFYVANTDAIIRYPYQPGQLSISEKGTKIADLPAGKHNQHWTRNIIANAAGTKIYVAVGSGSNAADHGVEAELLKANILEINRDGSAMRVYASGLRNPVGMGWAPGTKTLWTVVNERDGLGDELVPDYLTSVQEGGFYGWPYTYFGQHKDPRLKEQPAIVSKTNVPDVNLGAHTASLGLVFYDTNVFPDKYHGGAFISQHGSWNRSVLSGYKVVFVPFTNGKPSGVPEDFLTGFIADLNKEKVYGRPVGLLLLEDGSLLVADDVTNTLWKVSAKSVIGNE